MEEFTTDLANTIGEYYTSLVELMPKLGLALIIFILFFFIASSISGLLSRRLGGRVDDPLLVRFISRMVRSAIIIIACLLVLKIIGLGGIATSVMAGAGVGAFVIGFAFKDIGENFLAGIMMAFKRPFRLNDIVELSGIKGKVIALNLRDTQIKTFDGKDVFIPNGAVVKNPVINHTLDGYIRSDFAVGLDYDSDLQAAISLILDSLNSIKELEKDDKKPFVSIDELATSTVNIRVYYWINTFDPKIGSNELKNTVYTTVLSALTEAGYYMPADIMEVKNYGPNILKMETTNNIEKTPA